MEVIVTGAYGFIGSHFVNKLKELNPDCKVTIIDKLTYAANIENIKCDVNFIHEDIWDIKYLPAAADSTKDDIWLNSWGTEDSLLY